MLVAVLFTVLYLSYNNGEQIFAGDVYHTLYGNIATLRDLFIEPSSSLNLFPETTTAPPPDDNENDTLDIDDHYFDFPNVYNFKGAQLTNESFDLHDYNLINEKFHNFTKTVKSANKTRRFSYYDPDDIYHGEYIEGYKLALLKNVLIQYVMHCRYEVGKALTQREVIRNEKRYKLGYLFNRLRRLKTEQLKMVGVAWRQNETSSRSLYSMMRLYERVIHFDVDMRDTVKMIKDIYAVEMPYDVEVRFQSRKNKEGEGAPKELQG